MTIPAGKMNKRIRIERRYQTQDAMGQPSESWLTLYTRKASIKNTSGGTSKSATGIVATHTDEISIRYDLETKKVQTTDRVYVISTGEYYDIEQIENVMQTDRVLNLQCKHRSRGLA